MTTTEILKILFEQIEARQKAEKKTRDEKTARKLKAHTAKHTVTPARQRLR